MNSNLKTNPDYKVLLEPSPRRVRVRFNGETIADSIAAHLLFETRHLPVYYFPRGDVRVDLLTPTDHHSFFNEQVDAILVDGVAQPRPITKWSKDWKEKAATLPDQSGPVTRP